MNQETLDIVWIIIAGILVFFMQAGFAFLETGMVRSKNSVNVLMKNYVDMCFGATIFWALGFGIMFGYNPSGWIGTDLFFLSTATSYTYSFLFFQMMFAATVATILSGALAERIRYVAYIICAMVVSAIIYPIYGSWVWGSLSAESSGWLKNVGFIDFAGSTVVHSVGGWAALAGVIVLGPRLGRFTKIRNEDDKKKSARYIAGHNLPLLGLGAFILWLGFFGFNGGSTLAATATIGKIALNTHLAGCGGVIGAIITLAVQSKPKLVSYGVNGGLGGLVAICASADVILPGFALLTGFIAGIIVVLSIHFLESFGLDDAVGAVAVHGFAGVWGTLVVALFNPEDYFNFNQLLIQLAGIGVAFIWTFPSSWIIFSLVNKLYPLRVNTLDEQRGLDYSEHYEIGYPEFQHELLHPGKE